jgi:hypothetical protein
MFQHGFGTYPQLYLDGRRRLQRQSLTDVSKEEEEEGSNVPEEALVELMYSNAIHRHGPQPAGFGEY